MFSQAQQLSVAEIRDGWQVTRKHAIPLLEYCDRQRLTVREQDHRRAGPGLEIKLANDAECDTRFDTEKTLD
jgi:selenocysteine-specific elongation factor